LELEKIESKIKDKKPVKNMVNLDWIYESSDDDDEININKIEKTTSSNKQNIIQKFKEKAEEP